MALDIKLPHLGENIEEGQIVKILVKVGDLIEKNQNVLELETEKASIEIPLETSGKVKKIHISEGSTISVGQVFMTIEELSESNENTTNNPESEGKHSPIQTMTSPPTDRDIPLENTPSQEVIEAPNKPQIQGNNYQKTSPLVVPASPSTRRFAREIGIDITQITGSGPGGRISINDVKTFSKNLRSNVQISPEFAKSKPLPDFTNFGEVEMKPMSNIRIKTAERLSSSWSAIPHVTQFEKVDITDLERQRKLFSKQVEKQGGKLTITGIIIKVIGTALQKFPNFNASLDMVNKRIHLKKFYNVGVAVDTDHGLFVPVVRDVDKKKILELCLELSDLANKARSKKLTLEEMSGGTFTVSNLGGIGGTAFTPIINWPEVAILGVSKSRVEPTYVDGELQPRNLLCLSLSYDHRIIDGADGIRFLRWIAQALENPLILSM